jgi:nicotinate dehydrogenase subunit B
LRFTEVPEVEVALVDMPDAPSLGAGEAAQGPTSAAIANGLAHALGVRVRRLPLTPEHITQAM